ncbi:MAG: hypothetical protein SGILL_004158, partial [Bacillariaceae sp.]
MSTTTTDNATPENNNNADIKKQKQAMRKILRQAMKELSNEDIQTQSAQVWKRVLDLDVYKQARSVGLFLSMPSGEINTDAILEACVAQNKDIYFPEVGKNFELCNMELRKVILVDEGAEKKSNKHLQPLFHKQWPKNKWQIPEP